LCLLLRSISKVLPYLVKPILDLSTNSSTTFFNYRISKPIRYSGYTVLSIHNFSIAHISLFKCSVYHFTFTGKISLYAAAIQSSIGVPVSSAKLTKTTTQSPIPSTISFLSCLSIALQVSPTSSTSF
jgi:hypothetical protein